MGCATSMVKYLVFLANVIFAIAGISLITVGVLAHIGYDKYMDLAREVDLNNYKAPPILMIVIGSIIFVIAFLGCCGAIRESNCMMMTYAIILGILLVAEVTVVVVAHVRKDDFRDQFQKGLFASMGKYDGKDSPLTEGWDSMQQNLKCCGVNSYQDWKNTTWTPDPGQRVPKSCCRNPADENCQRNPETGGEFAEETLYTMGCLDSVLEEIRVDYIIFAGLGVAVLELLGIIFACCLAGRFRRKSYNYA